MPPTDDQLYAEDFAEGQTYVGASRTLDEVGFTSFAAFTGDDHPIHYDAAYAARTRFGRPIAHGLLLMSMTALGAAPLSRRLEGSMIALVDQGCRYLKPAFLGDRVTSSFEVASVESKPGKSLSVVRFAARLQSDSGEIILDGHHTYFLRTRPRA